MKKFLYPLTEKISEKTCGGKATNLSWLVRNGYNIPKGFCISPSLFRESLRQNQLQPLLDKFVIQLKNDSFSKELLAQISDRIVQIQFPHQILNQINKELKTLKRSRLAVRSSAVSEDGRQDSFAGIFESLLNVENEPEAVISAVKKIWSSLFDERVIYYIIKKKLSDFQFAIGVIVQEMIFAERFGVAFNIHPLYNDPDYLYIEETSTSGEKLVSGEISPQIDIISKQDVYSTKDLQKSSFQLCKEILEIEKKYSPAIDVEWVVENDELYLLQIRPVTSFDANKVKVWTDENVGEVLPEVVTPLTWSVLGPVTNYSFSWVLKKLGLLPPRHEPLFRLIYGKAYFNHTLFDKALFGAFHHGYFHDSRQFIKFGRRIFRLLKLITGLTTLILYLPFESRKFIRNISRTQYNPWKRNPTNDKIIAFVQDLLDKEKRIMQLHVANTFIGESIYQFINGWIQRFFSAELKMSAIDYVTAEVNIRSAESGLALQKLGHEIKNYLEQQQIQISDVKQFINLSADDEFIKGRVERFLSQYGYMSDQEFELSHPRWQEDPTTLKVLLFNIISGKKFKTKVLEDINHLSHITPGKNLLSGNILKIMIKLLRIFSYNRENLKQKFILCHFDLKNQLLKMAQNCLKDNLLKHSQDIYYLEIKEILQNLNSLNRQNHDQIQKSVEKRKNLYHRTKKMHYPYRLIEYDGNIIAPDYRLSKSADSLVGIGSSLGIVEGKVRVLQDFAEGIYLQKGEILVTHSANPGWTPLFIMSAGIITEIGGALSHAAIIAREYQIPMITSVEYACSYLQTGDFIRLDGGSGEIRLLKRTKSGKMRAEENIISC
jgi:pyruvate,water dikinase